MGVTTIDSVRQLTQVAWVIVAYNLAWIVPALVLWALWTHVGPRVLQIGAGISAMAAGRFATPEQLKEVAALFDSVGAVLTVSEEHLDAVTAVSGSGPAYFFLMIEALVDAGVGVGLSRAVSTELVAQTVAGSAALLLDRMEQDRGTGAESPRDLSLDTTPARLRAIVTSPGGTTAAALRELEKHGLRAAVDEAVRAAKTRSEQLRITSE